LFFVASLAHYTDCPIPRRIEIGRNMSNGDKYCTCSFSTKEVDVFDIQYDASLQHAFYWQDDVSCTHSLFGLMCAYRTLDVNQADGGVYFGFHNEICYKPNNSSSASCWVWPNSLVPDNEEFKYIYINQRTKPQLAHAHASQR
jgi:hypothetical protein